MHSGWAKRFFTGWALLVFLFLYLFMGGLQSFCFISFGFLRHFANELPIHMVLSLRQGDALGGD